MTRLFGVLIPRFKHRPAVPARPSSPAPPLPGGLSRSRRACSHRCYRRVSKSSSSSCHQAVRSRISASCSRPPKANLMLRRTESHGTSARVPCRHGPLGLQTAVRILPAVNHLEVAPAAAAAPQPSQRGRRPLDRVCCTATSGWSFSSVTAGAAQTSHRPLCPAA